MGGKSIVEVWYISTSFEKKQNRRSRTHFKLVPVFYVVACAHLHPKKSGSRVSQLKIADASKPHQKLVPVCIRAVPVCVRGGSKTEKFAYGETHYA